MKPSTSNSAEPVIVTPPAPPSAIRMLVDLIFAHVEAGTDLPS